MNGRGLTSIKCITMLFFLLNSQVFCKIIGKLDVSRLVTDTSLIVRAVVESKESAWGIDGHGNRHIFTTYQFSIKQVAKGRLRGITFELRVVGGTVGKISEIVEDGASFEIGEDVVLFLNGDPPVLASRQFCAYTVNKGKIAFDSLEIPADRFLEAIKEVGRNPDLNFRSLLAPAVPILK